MFVSAIILAGGKSTRMKYNKEFIKIGDSYLVHKQILLLKEYFDEIIVVSNNKEHYEGYPVTVVQDILHGNSPIIGLHAGLKSASNPYSFVIACDMPNINTKYMQYLLQTDLKHDAYVAKHNGFIEPFYALYSKNIIPVIEQAVNQNEFGFQRLVRKLDTFYIEESLVAKYNDSNMFLNINSEDDLLHRTRQYAPVLQSFEITKIDQNNQYQKTDSVITEYPLSLFINNTLYSLIMMTPKDIEFMIIGYLYTNELIETVEDIQELSIDLQSKKAFVKLDKQITKNSNRLEIISSACANNTKSIDEDLLPIVTKKNAFILEELFEHIAQFNKESALFKETGGVHSVKLFYGKKDILFEDIGRHNAVDKAIGFILKNNLINEKNFILTSGRISSDILIKCALSNIELIISRSAPTALAVRLGRKLNVKMYGFARGNKVNIYHN